MPCSHFKDDSVQDHIKCKRIEGIAASETHGHEPRGPLNVFLSSVKEVSILLLLVWTVLYEVQIPANHVLFILATVAGGWIIWKGCKSAYNAWNHLDYLHRIILQEKNEIENNREEEREELKEMYRSKGLEGKLLDDVIDVFMSDNDRLLKIMLEEEFGLTLGSYDHPLKVGTSACFSTFIAAALLLYSVVLFPLYGLPILAFVLLAVSEGILAFMHGRKVISSAVWTLAIGAASVGLSHFLIIWIQSTWLNT